MVLASVKYQLLFISILFSVTLFSQDKDDYYTLKQAIEIGMNNNKKLQINSIQEQTAITKEEDLKNDKLPDINFHTGFKVLSNIRQFENGVLHPATKYNVPDVQYDFTLSAEIPIYLGGKLKNEEHKAEIESEISKLNTRKNARQLRMEIITAFLHILHLRDQEELLIEKMHEDSVNIHHIDVLRKNGVVTNNEVLRSKLQLSNHKMAFTELENDVAIIEHQIKSLIAFPEDKNFHVTTDGIISTTDYLGLLDEMIIEAYSKDENLLIAKNVTHLKELDKKITKANQLPKITGSGMYGYNYPNFMFFPPEAHLYRFGSVGLNIIFPLSSIYKNKEKLSMAEHEISISKLEVEEKEERIRHDVYRANRKLIEADEKIKIAKEAIEQAAENYRIVKLKYNNQLSLITELIDADNAYLEAQSNLIALQINKQLKYYQLQYILGNI